MEYIVEGKPCINRESNALEPTAQLYLCYDEHESLTSCNTTVYLSLLLHSEELLLGKFHRWENFTLGGFSAINMKNCGCRNVRKHREIKGSYKYVTLNIFLKFDSLENMRITSSDAKFKLEI